MEHLYDNLDNYNEENTIAELQAENKELKFKLEEYAAILSKLQKDVDKLSSEHKQLQLNYSSLMKTARAEIERKTQIITNLNLEKDMMVLNSYQNKNARVFNKSRDCNYPMLQQYSKKDKWEITKQDEKLKEFEGRKSSPYSATERKEQGEPSRDKTASPHTDLRSKLLNLAHGGQEHDLRTENSMLKESITQPKNESVAFNARATIKNRRKSMPAISMETELLSDDDDLSSAASSKNIPNTNSEHNISKKHNIRERTRSRISETSSSEEKKSKKSGHCEQMPDSLKRQSKRYDRDGDDKHRVRRHKSSHRYKRQSPDRHQIGSREYQNPQNIGSMPVMFRSHDRHRAKGRIPESPPRDKLYQRPSRELHRETYERSYHYEHERLRPRSQERYPMKRKMEHGYNELHNKRGRMEPHYRQPEEDRRRELDNMRSKIDSHSISRHLEEDRKMKDERKPMDKKYITDPLEIQFSSCESPDYDYPEVSNQQVKEIKLTATTKLDDPRISSSKYVKEKNNGQVVLSTSIGRNVEMVPVRKIAWGVSSVSIPEALVKLPPESDQPTRSICMQIENPSNTSIESGEISDHEQKITQNIPQKLNKLKVPSSERKESPLPVPKFDDSKNIEKSLKNINSYKIPRVRKSMDDKQSSRLAKDITSSVKTVHDNTEDLKSDKNTNNTVIDIDASKQQAKPVKEAKEPKGHKQDRLKQSKNQLPCITTSNINEQKYSAAKEVVEGDLEMSDDDKFSKSVDDKQSSKHSKAITSSVKTVHDNTESFKIDKNTNITNIDIDASNEGAKPTKEAKEPKGHKQDRFKQSQNQLPCLVTSNIHGQKYSIAKEVVEGDLEMSDDDKIRKSVDDKQSSKHSKDIPYSVMAVQDNTESFKRDKNTNMTITDIDASKHGAKPAKEAMEPKGHKQDRFKQSKNQLPCLTTTIIYEKKYSIAKEVVEGDLEMSDDDNEKSDQYTKGPIISTKPEKKLIDKDKSCNTDIENLSTDTFQKVTVEPCKDKLSTGEDHKKSKNKKKSKHSKEIKHSAKVFEKPAKKKEKKTKSIQTKTKFSELFDDTSSLISPEDLGLAAVLAPTQLPDKCIPFFEDAQDASDLNRIKSDVIKISSFPEKSNVENISHIDVTVTKIDTGSQENTLEMTDCRSNDVQTGVTDDIIKSIYQNLEPGVPEQEANVVKTIIISTGVQPPVLLENDKPLLPSKPALQMKAIQDVGLKALATSTPRKIWKPAITADIDTKLPDSSCNSNDNSKIASVGNSSTMSVSNSITVDSHTDAISKPDVRIVVSRRRKVIKK